jgi:phenylalanyl-tRNA synthetase beta chain
MKISIEWLKEYVDFDLSNEQLAEKLTQVGFPTESSEQVGGDTVLDLEIPSNRPDCFGIVGIAREVATVLGLALRLPEPDLGASEEVAGKQIKVLVEDQELCPRYIARIVRDIKIGPSPDWMQRRLISMGLRPVNNIVDITNYVLLETGQPLHAFDYDLVDGHFIIIRRARPVESFELLDGKKLELEGNEIVIADGSGPVALAGVMGGSRTEVHSGTVNILLESASFLPAAIRRTSRRLTIATESSYRFERGTDWNCVDYASRRAAALMRELGGGSVNQGLVDVAATQPRQQQIMLRYWRVDKVLGRRMEKRVIRRILLDLGLESVYESGEGINLLVPSFRPDLTREIDLIEDLARHFGYDKIPAKTEIKVLLARKSPADVATGLVRKKMVAMGFSETVTLSILNCHKAKAVGPWRCADDLIISNPPRSDQNMLRMSLLPSLLEVCRVNQAAGRAQLSVFDMGRVYLSQSDGSIDERRIFSALDDRPADVQQSLSRIRAVLENACGIFSNTSSLRLDLSPLTYMAPEQSARVFLGNEFLGVTGRLHQKLCKLFDLRSQPAMLELDFDMLIRRGLVRKGVKPMPRFPGIKRDVALVIDEGLNWARVASAVESVECQLRQSTEFLNVYRGKQVGSGKKSVAFSVTYRSPERTLTDDEVNLLHSELLKSLLESLGAVLRA